MSGKEISDNEIIIQMKDHVTSQKKITKKKVNSPKAGPSGLTKSSEKVIDDYHSSASETGEDEL